jgi:hypothetical protein
MESADVLIQAGHEDCPEEGGSTGPCGNEIDWTPVVADEATRVLRSAGLSVLRCNALFDIPNRVYSVDTAVFLHFDGSSSHNSRASVGYATDPEFSSHLQEDADMGKQWKSLYSDFWPFGFMEDNFTPSLEYYYGYNHVTARKGKLLIEFGDLSNNEQAEWLSPRLKFLGQLVAFFVCQRLGRGEVPSPVQRTGALQVSRPTTGDIILSDQSVEFSGDSSSDVDQVIILIGPGGPFRLGSIRPKNGKWAISQTLINAGENRPVTFQALSSDGVVLQEVKRRITVRNPGQHDGSQLDSLYPWRLFYAGLSLDGDKIPRQGIQNSTLESALGVSIEPHGEIVKFMGFDFVKGLVSSFGGPDDTGISEDETAALTGERLRDLKDDDYYCAMRWCYPPQGRSFWANRRLLVINPINQKAVVVRAIDWGPHTKTGRTIDLSPKCLSVLGLETDYEAICAFAKPESAKIGLLREL